MLGGGCMADACYDNFIGYVLSRYTKDPSCKHELDREYFNRIEGEKKNVQRNMIRFILLNLYRNDVKALKQDICDFSLLEINEADSINNRECLKAILPCLLKLCNGDVSELLSLFPNNLPIIPL